MNHQTSTQLRGLYVNVNTQSGTIKNNTMHVYSRLHVENVSVHLMNASTCVVSIRVTVSATIRVTVSIKSMTDGPFYRPIYRPIKWANFHDRRPILSDNFFSEYGGFFR